MGKAGRFACIFTPMVLTIGSLVCLVIVALGGTNKSNSLYNNLYFFRANTSDITISPSDLPDGIKIPDTPLTEGLINETTNAVASALGVYDFYHISLWNYCSGNFTSSQAHNSSASASVADNVTFCSPHTNAFWFNPVDVWHLNNTGVDKLFSSELTSALNTYHTAAKWMFIAYVVALISTIVEIVIGFTALLSRLGSVATTIVSTISTVFTVGFALTATILYSTLTATFNDALKKYNVHGNLGHNMYVAIWLAVAFSLASGFFWLLSSCCCSGRSNRIKGYDDSGRASGRGWGKKGRGDYNRVESPLPGGMNYGEPAQGYPQFQHRAQQPQYGANVGPGQVGRQESYEPFRHV